MVGIKGWEMPNSCQECCFKGYVIEDHRGNGFYYCHPSGKTLDGRELKPDFCPLVEVPDWHDVNYLLPLFGKEVLIYDDDTGVHLGFLSQYGNWETDECTLDAVTHWQQIVLPEK